MRWGILIPLAALLLSCSGPTRITGGSSDSGNPCVVAKVANPDGSPAVGVAVTLVPSMYLMPLALAKAASPLRQLITDDSGSFRIDSLDSGEYCIEVNDQAAAACRIHCNLSGEDDVKDLGGFMLRPYAAVTGSIDTIGTGGAKRFVQVYGLHRITQIQPDGTFRLDSLPADSFRMRVVSDDNSVPPLEFEVAAATPGDTIHVLWPWRFTKRLYLNTTPSGADVSGMLVGFPVLVRLRQGNFDFDQALSEGADIRFTKPDGTALPCEIERWDAANGQAEVWVRLDTVHGNNDVQYVTMFWGNPAARTVSDPEAVFDTTAGFQGVWHLSEATGQTVLDATVNQYDGIPNGTRIAEDGMIGAAQSFNGSADFIQIPNSGASKLNFPEHGTYAVSAWVYANVLDSTYRMIVSKGDYQYSLEIMDSCTWEFAECQTTEGFDVTQVPATAQAWAYVTGVRNGERQYLFVDGVCVDSTIQSLSPPTIRDSGFDVIIGRRSDESTYFFNGKIDEVRMTNVPLSADWVKLCYMNQKPNDALVVFK